MSLELPPEERAQLHRVIAALRSVLGDELVGAYLFGSAVSNGLRPRSDLDVMAVVMSRTSTDQKTRLVQQLLGISGHPRHLEVTIVVETDIRPWRYPPRMELQYGDWWRKEFEGGDLQPWEEINPDLASLISMVLDGSTVLHGPPPDHIFDPVPHDDYRTALRQGIPRLIEDLPSDATNIVLTLARIWCALETGEGRSKDAAADWALLRLPEEHEPVLAEARSIYLEETPDQSPDFVVRAELYAEHVLGQIGGTAQGSDAYSGGTT